MASAISSAGTAPSNNVPSPPPEPDAKPGDETAASSDSTKSDPPKDVIALPSAGASLSPEAAANFDRALYRAGQAADNTDTPAADHENWTDASDAPPAGQLTDKERAARLAEIKADPERYLSITKPVIPPGSGGFAPETEGEISDADAAAFRQGLIDRGVLDPETGELKIGARPLSHGPLDPLASNDGDVTAEAAAGPASVNDLFVNGPPKGSLDNATIKRLDGWLPDAIQNGGGNYVKDGQRSEDIVALAKSMGYEGSQVWERDGRDSEKRVTQYSATGAANFLRDVAEQDAVFDSAAELPSAFDIYDSAMTDRTADKLSGMDDKARRESFVRNLDGGTDLLDRQTDFEKSDFQKLDTWLPSALAGQGEMPNDAGSQTLLVKFAERLGWSNMPEKPGNTDRGSVQFATYERARQDARNMPVEDKADLALDYLKQERFLQKSLVVGSEAGDERASLIFEDGFVGKVVQHGVNQGVITDAVAVDAAMTAGALMNSAAQMNGASADGPVALNPGQFAQALAQRLSPEAVDPKRMMAGFNYVQRAGSLEQQQQRLTETILAFQTKDQAGIGAMTRTTWTEGLADYSGKLADIIGRRIEDPTSKRIANVLDHVGVPGYEKIKLSKGTKLHLANDETGRVADIQVEKKQNGFARFAMDAIMTGLSFTPAAPAAAGYFAMRGVEAAVKGDGIGAVTAGLGAVGGFASSFAAAANGAGAAAKIAQGARLASGAVGVQQGLKNGDLLGAVTSGLSAFSAGAQLNGASGLAQGTANLSRAASGIDAALDKDYLSAASAFSTAAGSQFGGDNGTPQPTANNIEKITTLAGGILNKDASQIVSAFGDEIGALTEDWPELNRPAPTPAPTSPIGPNTALDDQGNPILLPAGYDGPSASPIPDTQTLQIAPGDTLSQIAERHGTSVDALMAANPQISDPHSIAAGGLLTLPRGVTPIGLGQQQQLNDFDNVQGRPILPSPSRPELGDPLAQPDATHPNADPHTPAHAQPGATHPNDSSGNATNGEAAPLTHLTDTAAGVGGALGVVEKKSDEIGNEHRSAENESRKNADKMAEVGDDLESSGRQTGADHARGVADDYSQNANQAKRVADVADGIGSVAGSTAKVLGRYAGPAVGAAEAIMNAPDDATRTELWTNGMIGALKEADDTFVSWLAGFVVGGGSSFAVGPVGGVALGAGAGYAAGRQYNETGPDEIFDSFVESLREPIQERLGNAERYLGIIRDAIQKARDDQGM